MGNVIRIEDRIVEASLAPVVPEKQKKSSGLIERPTELQGSTYKLECAHSENSYYLTVNDIELEGRKVPFEVFIKSKNVMNLHSLEAHMFTISAHLREKCNKEPGSQLFLIKKLKSTKDYRGPYYVKGKRFDSLEAHIGDCLESHFSRLGIFDKEFEERNTVNAQKEQKTQRGMLCHKCGSMAVISIDGCKTCTECGSSACGG